MEFQFEFEQIMGLTQSGKNVHKHRGVVVEGCLMRCDVYVCEWVCFVIGLLLSVMKQALGLFDINS